MTIQNPEPPGAFIKAFPGDPRIKAVLNQGATIYSKSGDPYIYIVPVGVTHSDAWHLVTT